MEGYLMALSEIEMCVVVGVPHPRYDERPVVVCVVKKAIGKDRILAHLANKYAKFQIPDDVLFWDEIPVTGTGKIPKKTVREELKRQGYVLPALRTTSKL